MAFTSYTADDLPIPSLSNVVTRKLDRNNYLFWVAQIIHPLKSHILIYFINGSSTCPVGILLDDKGKLTNNINPSYND
ncbi:unnamed protein product [Prunus armeniaca]